MRYALTAQPVSSKLKMAQTTICSCRVRRFTPCSITFRPRIHNREIKNAEADLTGQVTPVYEFPCSPLAESFRGPFACAAYRPPAREVVSSIPNPKTPGVRGRAGGNNAAERDGGQTPSAPGTPPGQTPEGLPIRANGRQSNPISNRTFSRSFSHPGESTCQAKASR